MQSKGSSSRLSGTMYTSRISTLVLSMLATIASFYVAGRKDYVTMYRKSMLFGSRREGQSAVSVDDTLKIIACREQQKKLSALEMELAAARPEGFKLNHLAVTNQPPKKRPLVVIGVLTGFSRKTNRDAIRKAWMGTGSALKKMEDRKGIIVRFVIGRSSNRGDSLERAIDSENKHTNDFIILENHIEALEELPNKTKNFFAQASEKWDAEFFAKVNDDVYVNIDALGSALAAHLDKPRAYIGYAADMLGLTLTAWFSLFPISMIGFSYATDLFFVLMPMTMLVLVPGLLGLMLNMLMRKLFAAHPHLGHQELYAQVYDHTKNHEKNNSNNKFQKYLKDAGYNI
ncbi:hypothetical protein RHGRI_008635 [Rhododendron griersonianum]|uniref:Hexosyltransferase n=1 Tax=Rhododendron griersonianum TaxID=479676 RepID=A0AAV6L1V8_9ERIC|nr:hypothetical protein RHGRI_008635 [Rhododendron griersonianum]